MRERKRCEGNACNNRPSIKKCVSAHMYRKGRTKEKL
jgi:hypothetical protein